jgi:D-sedoheptulose 7-phosphate isomerase
MFQSFFKQYQSQFVETLQSLDEGTVTAICEKIEDARLNEKQVFVLGNGGSASSSSHWACDFGKGINVDRQKRLKIVSLSDPGAVISALGNDIGFADIFVEQLKNLLMPGDLVIGLSVSGDSENIVRAFRYANATGATVISLVGQNEGRMKEHSDLPLVIPSYNYGIVEDIHMFVNHVISQYIRMKNENTALSGEL